MSDTIISALAALSGVFVGFFLQAWRDNRVRNVQEAHEVQAFRLGILAEIRSLWKGYMMSIGQQMEEYTSGAPFLWLYPVHSEYFTVFENNSHMLGRLKNNEERELIIMAYNIAKGLVDSYAFNNRLLENFHRLVAVNDPAVPSLTAELVRYAEGIKSRHELAKSMKDSLIERLSQPLK